MSQPAHNLVEIDRDKLEGTPVFDGTRVPVQNLIDCIETGESIDEFLEQYPTVSREQVSAFIKQQNEH